MESKELVTLNPEKEIPTTTSLLVAEKFDKNHSVVLKAIRKLISDSKNLDISQGYSDLREYRNRGREYPSGRSEQITARLNWTKKCGKR